MTAIFIKIWDVGRNRNSHIRADRIISIEEAGYAETDLVWEVGNEARTVRIDESADTFMRRLQTAAAAVAG